LAQEKIKIVLRKIDTLFETRTFYILFLILATSFLIRLFLLPERWINPDEGAHLYDAKFILEGKIPFVDYGSRMPVYVYILAVFLKVFGASYISGRLLPLFSNIGIGIILFFIGKKLFNSNKIALLASAIYLFSPLSILWSVVVKTEQLETLFVTIGMFLLISFIKLKQENYNLVFISGIFFALAYYVRESSIAVFIISILFVINYYGLRTAKMVKTSITMVSGYFLVVFIIILYFSSFAGLDAVLESPLNPMDTIKDPIKKIITTQEKITDDKIAVKDAMTNDDMKEYIHQPFDQTIEDWIRVFKLDSFLLFGAAIFFVCYFVQNKKNIILSKLQFTFLGLWLFALAIFYLYYSIRTSFFTPYFGEFLPALALVLAYVIVFLISEMENHDTLKRKIATISFIVIIALYISSLSLVSISFDCVYSPNTVNEISQYIKSHSTKDDVVLSGAMIWTFESNTRPFMNKTHPSGYLRKMDDDQIIQIDNEMEKEKPEFIILDGYTEKIFLGKVNSIRNSLNESYILGKEDHGSRYPVKVYQLNE
jgi:4-amino-4-deoxy-L-arabinose transferase-like glycosyltransferase